MRTKLDHIYGGGGGNITALEQKVNNLSQITVKNNIANQELPQQKITTIPTDGKNIIRLDDIKFKQLIATSTELTANTVSSGWTYAFDTQSIYTFIVRFGVVGTNADQGFSTSIYLHNPNYWNNGQVFSLASNENNLTDDIKIKFWIKNKKVYLLCNKNIKPITIFIKKEAK